MKVAVWERKPRPAGKRRWKPEGDDGNFRWAGDWGSCTSTPLSGRDATNQRRRCGTWVLHWGLERPSHGWTEAVRFRLWSFWGQLETRDPKDHSTHSKAATRPVTREIAVPGPSRSAVFNVPLLLQSCMQPISRDNNRRHSQAVKQSNTRQSVQSENLWSAAGDTCFILLRSVFGTLRPNNHSNQRLQQFQSASFLFVPHQSFTVELRVTSFPSLPLEPGCLARSGPGASETKRSRAGLGVVCPASRLPASLGTDAGSSKVQVRSSKLRLRESEAPCRRRPRRNSKSIFIFELLQTPSRQKRASSG